MSKEDWTAQQWADYYEELEQRNYHNFQDSGISSYERASFRYGKIAEAFRALVWKESERAVDMKRRINNCDYMISRLIPTKDYSAQEVADLLKQTIWW